MSKTDTVLPPSKFYPRFRSAYHPRVRVIATPSDAEGAKQSFKDECDINIIMSRYQQTGSLDFVQKREARYLDVTGYDFQEAQQLVAGARTLFEELPAKIRDRFENDPAKLLDFVADEKNQLEAVRLGLASPAPSVATPPPPLPSSTSPQPPTPAPATPAVAPAPAVAGK